MAARKKDARNRAELRLTGSNTKPGKEKSKVISKWITGIANIIKQDRKDGRTCLLFFLNL